MAIRIATIVAVGRHSDAVAIEDVRFGCEMADRSVRLIIDGASDYMAENENQASAQKVLRIIRERVGRISHRDLMRAMQHSVRGRDFRDLINGLCEAEQIKRQQLVPVSDRPHFSTQYSNSSIFNSIQKLLR